MIYLRSIRDLLANLVLAARTFAEDYNSTGYEVSRAEAEARCPNLIEQEVRTEMRAQLINDLCADWGREIEHSLDANVAEWGAL